MLWTFSAGAIWGLWPVEQSLDPAPDFFAPAALQELVVYNPPRVYLEVLEERNALRFLYRGRSGAVDAIEGPVEERKHERPRSVSRDATHPVGDLGLVVGCCPYVRGRVGSGPSAAGLLAARGGFPDPQVLLVPTDLLVGGGVLITRPSTRAVGATTRARTLAAVAGSLPVYVIPM